MDCLLDAVFDALRGDRPAHPAMVAPPVGVPIGAGFHGAAIRGAAFRRAPPPALAKPTYGRDLAYHLDGADFTVQWTDPGIDPDRARAILDQLEGGWQHLIVEDGWPRPVSADAWRLWVILDPTVAGSGYTTIYPTGDYPDGYPVSYLNPDYALDEDVRYELSVAVHEFGHMVQYGVRDWNHSDAEAWYWEASAEWMAERGAPEIDTYAWSTYWYAIAPERRYDSQAEGHAYGMLIVDAWLEEYAVGPLGIRDLWVGAGVSDWPDVLEAAAGTDLGELIRNVSGAFAADALRESAAFYDPTLLAEDLDGVGTWTVAAPDAFGTYYLSVDHLPDGATFWADDGVVLAFAADDTWTDTPPASGPFIVTLTEVGAGPSLTYGIGEAPVDTAGGGEDTAGGGEDTAADRDSGRDDPDKAAACGCASGRAGAGEAWCVVALLVVGRRRRPGPSLARGNFEPGGLAPLRHDREAGHEPRHPGPRARGR